MNYNTMMRKIEMILQAVEKRPKRKKAGAKGMMAPREGSPMPSAKGKPSGELPVELQLARYVKKIRDAKAEMKKAMEKNNAR
jgi:hypothetical protein